MEEDGSSDFHADKIFLDPEYWDTVIFRGLNSEDLTSDVSVCAHEILL